MNIVARCPKCDASLPLSAADAPAAIKCGGCGRDIPLTLSAAVRGDSAVDRCPVCNGADFYIRKDFNPRVGLTVVIIGALISGLFYWFGRDIVPTAFCVSGADRFDCLRMIEGRHCPLPLSQ